MSKSDSNHSVQGSWRGQYYYAGDSNANGFEAVFVDIKGVVEGNILDDGRLGEAVVGGSFSYPELRFTKVYRQAGTHAVRYIGTMSENGKVIRGRWVIPGATTGTWVAIRYSDGEEINFEEIEDGLYRDKEEVQPLTAPGRAGPQLP